MKHSLALAVLGLWACGRSERIEAEHALATAPHVRALEVNEQREALAQLTALTCADPDVCRVKTTCLAVVTPTLSGLQDRDAALLQMKELADFHLDGSMDDLAAARDHAGALVDSAKERLETAKQAVPQCEAALSILERAARAK